MPVTRPVVLFCTAAGGAYGYGHLKRCMTLIDEGSSLFEGILYIRTGADSEFSGYGDVSSRYTSVSTLEEAGSVDLIFSDQRDTRGRVMRRYSRRAPVVSLDDRGAGRRFAHTTIFALPTVEGYTGNFTGPGYIVLDRAIRDAGMATQRGIIREGRTDVVVSFGGADPYNLTGLVTGALNRIGVRPVVVQGPLFTHEMPDGDYTLADKSGNMGEILTRATVLITSFGMTVFEARFLGVPLILLNHSRYHDELAATLKGGVVNLGYYGTVGEEELSGRLEAALANQHDLRGCADLGPEEIDDRGTERILSVIEKALHAGRQGCFFGHGVYAALKRENTYTLMACRRCGDIFLHELEGPGDIYGKGDYFLSEYRAQYGKSYIDDRKNISRMAKERLDIIERYTKRGSGRGCSVHVQRHSVQSKMLLDVGCALGFFLDVARERGWEPTGVEVSGFAADWAQIHLGMSVINSSFLDTSFEPESFDVITFFFVVEHFKDVEKVIERAYTVLIRGGLIAFALPNGSGASSRIDRRQYVHGHPRDHYFDTCPRNFVRFLRTYGFRKCRVRVTGIHPERFFRKLGVRRNISLLNTLYTGIARVLRLGDTFEYYGIKV